MSFTTPYRLETLGLLSLSGRQGAINASDQRQQHRRLALFAALAAAGEKGLSRDQLLLLFWPDSTQKKARHSLDQLLYAIRSSLDESIFAGINPIRLDPGLISSDVDDFRTALKLGETETAVTFYRGPFLDGFYLSDSREFEEWVNGIRSSLAHGYEDALEALARKALLDADFDAAIQWKRKLCEVDPFSSRYMIALMQTLVEAGDLSGALARGERFVFTAAREIGPEAVAGVKELLNGLKSAPPKAAIIQRTHAPQFDAASLVNSRAGRIRKRKPFALLSSTALIAVLLLFVGIAATIKTDSSASAEKATPPGTTSVAAYEYYLRGKDPVMLRSDSSVILAIAHVTQALQLDPGFAAAYAELANLTTRLAMSTRPSWPRSKLKRDAEAFARKAIELDESLADGHVALGLAHSHFYDDLDLAEREFQRALALNPKASNAREYLSIARLLRGERGEAIRDARQGVLDNPLSPVARSTLGIVLYATGKCDEALPILNSLSQLNPPLLRAQIALSLCFSSLGRWQEAINAVEIQLANGTPRAMGVAGFAMARSGDREAALEIQKKLRAIAQENVAAYFDLALVNYGLGDMHEASRALDLAAENGLVPWELMGPVFEPLRRAPSTDNVAARPNNQSATF